jgi:hypothetical protein
MISLNTTGWIAGMLMVFTGCRIFNRFLALQPELASEMFSKRSKRRKPLGDLFFDQLMFFILAPILTVGGTVLLRRERQSLAREAAMEARIEAEQKAHYEAQCAQEEALRAKELVAFEDFYGHKVRHP